MRRSRTLAVLGLMWLSACSHPTASVPVAPFQRRQRLVFRLPSSSRTAGGIDLKPATSGIEQEGPDGSPDTVQHAEAGQLSARR